MRPMEQIIAGARNEPPFSNSTEWEIWSASWCDRCLREAPFRNGITDGGCPLVTVAVCYRLTPSEWLEQPDDSPDRFSCMEFRPPGGGGGEPRPRPEPPQDGLFPRPERQARMLSPVRSLQSVPEVAR